MNLQKLSDCYTLFKEASLTRYVINHQDIIPLIEKRDSAIFDICIAGKSYQERPIYLLKVGTGKTKIMLWSQMHGDEPTATGALFDLFQFIENPGEFDEILEKILQSCTLYFIPMLNPDGAELFQRRNAQGIDINRDALQPETPEGKLLMQQILKQQPEFAFNLHDQETAYAAAAGKPATLSFLAPAFDETKSQSIHRKKAMQIISSMAASLEKFIPGQIGKYYDDFMPSAFGDQIQAKGISTILIESGGAWNDPEKQQVRQLNFMAILQALHTIAENRIDQNPLSVYENLPFNRKNTFFDFLIKNATINSRPYNFRADVGIRRRYKNGKPEFIVEDLGKLSGYKGYLEKDLQLSNIETVTINSDAQNLVKKYFKL